MLTDYLNNSPATAWHPEYPYALAIVTLMLLILVRHRSEGMALLKSALAFFFTVVLLVLASFVSYAVGQTTVAQVLDEMAILLVGTLTIRVFGLTAFRVFLPSIGFMPPPHTRRYYPGARVHCLGHGTNESSWRPPVWIDHHLSGHNGDSRVLHARYSRKHSLWACVAT